MKCFVIYLDYPLSQLYGKNKQTKTTQLLCSQSSTLLNECLNLITNVSKYMKK